MEFNCNGRQDGDRISELELKLQREIAREIEAFKERCEPEEPHQARETRPQPVEFSPKAAHSPKQKRERELREGTVVLTVGYIASTLPGSLYSTILRVLAERGHLALHAHLFEQFRNDQIAAGAKKLLRKIGVDRLALDQAVRDDELFKEHCKKRTRKLIERAAKGDPKAISIMNAPEICNERGQWRGDIDEAIDILYGARSPKLTGTRKNTHILRRLKLCFDRSTRDGEQFCFLYPAKCYALFQRARALAAE